MIQIIHGKKGTGKTKRILAMSEQAVKDQKGSVVFVDFDNRKMFDIKPEIRFVNGGEYGCDSPEMFLGLVTGMLALNYDINVIFVDATLKLIKKDLACCEEFFTRLNALSEKHNVQIVLSVNIGDEEAPEYLAQYYI